MKILSVTYGGGHVRIAAKMAETYMARGIDYQIVALPAAIPYLNALNIPYKRLIDYADCFQNWDEIYSLGEKLAKEYHNEEAGFSVEDTICYYGLSYYDLMRVSGEEKARELFEKTGRKAFHPKESAKTIIKAENPDVIQITSGVRMELAVSNAAKELNIPTARIQDTPMNYRSMATDYLFTINEVEKKRNIQVMKYGVKRIIPTGHPCFENYSTLDKDTERAKIDEELKINGKYLITWAIPGCYNDYIDETYLILKKMAITNPDRSIVIKLHPTSHSESMFDSYGEPPKNLRVVKDCNLPSLLKASDLVIAGNSTTGFEAVLLDCNEIVIMRGHTEYLHEPNYYNQEVIIDLDKLADRIDDFLYDEETKRRAAEGRKGLTAVKNASENIADEMIKIYNSTKTA